jgi:amidase
MPILVTPFGGPWNALEGTLEPEETDVGADTAATDITALGATALSDAIHARQISCLEVMDGYLARIAALNARANAIVSMKDGDALRTEARERDAELARGISRGWLHGVPQAIKDLAATKDLPTTHGSPILADFRPAADAIFVERMRASGAILIGKTNVPEFGLGSNTYNPVFGRTANAYDPTRVAGGSSGGAAVALALRLLPVADGSDHGGSLRNPAAFNNVLGLRPSSGRVPIGTDEVFLPQLGVAGPMARNVADLGRLLAVQAGYDPRSPMAQTGDPASYVDVRPGDLRGMRLAWLGDLGGHLPFEPGVLALCEAQLKTFEALGARVEPVVPDFDMETVFQAWCTLRHWLVGGALDVHFRDPARRALMKPEARWECELGQSVTALDVHKASVRRSAWYAVVERLFRDYDALLLPSAQVFPFDLDTTWPREIAGRTMDTYHRWMEVVVPITMSGCPAISVPVGFDPRGLPMGMQVVAPNLAERRLLEIAAAYEEATGFDRERPPGA